MGVEELSSKAAKASWPSFLRGDSREILARLAESDPLRLCERTARRLREVWILLNPDRVFRRVLMVCADAVPCEPPPEDLAAWGLSKIDLAIEQLVEADREAERTRPHQLTEEEADFPLLTECLMMEPELVRSASVAFNALDPLPRRAFFELLIDAKPVPEVVEAGPWDEDGLYQAIQTALATVDLDVPGPSKDDRKKGKKKR